MGHYLSEMESDAQWEKSTRDTYRIRRIKETMASRSLSDLTVQDLFDLVYILRTSTNYYNEEALDRLEDSAGLKRYTPEMRLNNNGA